MFRHLACLTALILAAATARAQDLEAYAGLEINHAANLNDSSAFLNGSEQDTYKSITPVGPTLGVTWYRFRNDNASLGTDLRVTLPPGAAGVFVAEKLSVHPGSNRVRPYAELGLYVANFRTPTSYYNPATQAYITYPNASQTLFTYKVAGGLDYDIGHNLSYRIVEVGGFPAISSNRASSLTVTTGIVARF